MKLEIDLWFLKVNLHFNDEQLLYVFLSLNSLLTDLSWVTNRDIAVLLFLDAIWFVCITNASKASKPLINTYFNCSESL